MSTYTIVAISAFIFGLFFGWVLLSKNAHESTLTWKYGKSQLALNVKQDLVSPDTFLKKIFSDPNAKNGTITWLKTTQSIFPASDPDLADQIVTLDFSTPLGKRLRDISLAREGPWKQVGKEITIGIPARNRQPALHQANVCENGPFRGAKVLLQTIAGPGRDVTVQAAGIYPCPVGFTFPDLQLNASDGKDLFGDYLFKQGQRAKAAIVD